MPQGFKELRVIFSKLGAPRKEFITRQEFVLNPRYPVGLSALAMGCTCNLKLACTKKLFVERKLEIKVRKTSSAICFSVLVSYFVPVMFCAIKKAY